MSKNKSKRGEFQYVPNPYPKRNKDLPKGDVRIANAMSVGEFAFEVERLIRERRGRVDRASFPIAGNSIDGKKLADSLESLFQYVLVEDIQVCARKSQFEVGSLADDVQPQHPPHVCLFSGGTDSLSGLLAAQQHYGSVEGVFCAHSDQSRMIHIVKELQRKVLNRAGITVHKVGVPKMGKRGYAQLRGYLYILAAATWMKALNSSTLIVTECGPTMYQPRFSPFDAVTMTTHPVVVSHARDALEVILDREITILTPFENLTKAETLSICPNKPALKHTHSCISQRFGDHDGTCYGCVIRRLAAIAANTPDVRYRKNPISDERASSGNLLSLLSFSFDVLTNYEGMAFFETDLIEGYGKQDLFRRFALDNFAAVHRLIVGGHRVRQSIRRTYEDLIAELGVSILDRRLRKLEGGKFKPSF